MPETGGEQECRKEPHFVAEKFRAEEIHANDRENARDRGREPHDPRFITECFNAENKRVHVESFAAVVFGVKNLEMPGLHDLKRIIAVHRLVGIESGRRGRDMV